LHNSEGKLARKKHRNKIHQLKEKKRIQKSKMDFFTSQANDITSPTAQMVKAATDPTLDGPDWSRYVCIMLFSGMLTT
jgi:hypothetical protein